MFIFSCKDLTHWSVGWTDWNMALNLQGLPSWVGNRINSPIIINDTAQEYYKQPHFYVMGHFSKFISPGSIRVDHQVDKDVDSLQTIAFVRPDGATVLVAVNYGTESAKLVIKDPKLGKATKTIEANSIQSYIWWP